MNWTHESFSLTESCPLYNNFDMDGPVKVPVVGKPVKIQGQKDPHSVAEAPTTSATKMILMIGAAVATVLFVGIAFLVVKFRRLENSSLLKHGNDLRGYSSFSY